MASKIVRVIELLRDRTRRNQLHWQPTARKGVYQAAFPNMTILISQRPNKELAGVKDIVVGIHNAEGETVEEVSDVDLQGDLTNSEQVMHEIYEVARRQALGVDKYLDNLLEYLEDEESAST
jgi:hypothetical protein